MTTYDEKIKEAREHRFARIGLGRIWRGFAYRRIETHDETRSPNYEKAFQEEWQYINENRQFRSLLQQLFIHKEIQVIPIKNHDKWVASTVIQWLGTNVGRGFLHAAFRRAGYEMTLTKIKKDD